MMPLLVVAIGQTFVLIVAGIDLSATSILAMSSVLGGRGHDAATAGRLAGAPAWLAIAAGIVAFLAVGSALGALQRRLHHAVQHAALHRHADHDDVLLRRSRSGSRRCSHRRRQLDRQPAARASPSSARAGSRGLPFSLLIALVVCVTAHVVLSRTLYGRWLFAIGLNPRAAEVSGVPVRRVVFWAFVICGPVRGARRHPLHRPARDRHAGAGPAHPARRRRRRRDRRRQPVRRQGQGDLGRVRRPVPHRGRQGPVSCWACRWPRCSRSRAA